MLSKFKNFPNVVNVHRVFVDDHSDAEDADWKMEKYKNKVSIVQIMDHCPYGSLHDLVTETGRLPPRLARHIAGQIVAFIAEAHSVQESAHLRLNPHSCLFDSHKRLKVSDLRNARFIKPDCAK